MKKQCVHCGLIIVLCLGFLELSALADSKSYPMVCRGGGNMSAMYGRVGGESIVAIKFERSPYADNQQHRGEAQGTGDLGKT